jgi:hypothetical protein
VSSELVGLFKSHRVEFVILGSFFVDRLHIGRGWFLLIPILIYRRFCVFSGGGGGTRGVYRSCGYKIVVIRPLKWMGLRKDIP